MMLGKALALPTTTSYCRLKSGTCLMKLSYQSLNPGKSSISSHIALGVLRCNSSSRSPTSHIQHITSVKKISSTKEIENANSSTSQLDWNTFFHLRKKRRWYQQFFSFGAGLGGTIGSSQVLMHSDLDAIFSISQIPLDPFITLGLITLASGGLGWLLGPVAGTALFNWKTREFRVQMDNREKEFYKRVRKYRVDPSNSSMANPVPDYYCEKVSSVQDYRRWLKDCRAFNQKRTTYLK